MRSIDDFRDIESLNHYATTVAAGAAPEAVVASMRSHSRDNARTPMQWDAGEHAGFTTGTPWIAVNPNHDEINAEAEVADPGSVFHHYRRLIELRHTEPVVAHGTFTMLLPDHPAVYAFSRRLGDTELLVLGNFSAGPVTLDPAELAGRPITDVLITNVTDPMPFTLQPWEGTVYRRS